MQQFFETCENTVRFIAHHIWSYTKLGKPTLLHSINVWSLLIKTSCSPNVCLAWFLHDIIEDTDITSEYLLERYGDTITELILANTKDMSLPKEERDVELFARCAKTGIGAMLIKAADIIDNWTYFSQVDQPDKQARITHLATLFATYLDPTQHHPVFDLFRTTKEKMKT